ncbi:MAG: ABC transporter permease, partial [Acidimicrobiia bacterium]|nr:ABC transporter permease [Acidimicrobiia bacterium]
MVLLENALLGIIFGGIYALSATGIVLTYTATGVFNIAHFAVALLAGYLAWELNGGLGLPMVATVPVVLLLCGPVLGVALERLVFRPLQARGASSSEKLVAALGVSVLILAVINIVWGPGVQGTTDEPVPRLFPVEPFQLGSLRFDTEQVGVVASILVIAGLLWFLLRRTFLGTRIRAVVDRRELAELAGIDANRVSQVAWALGCTLGALTGLLIAPPALEPTRIIILGIETFSVAVVARLTSIPMALAFGFFVLGMGRGMLDGFAPFGEGSGTLPQLYDQVVLNLSSVVLFGALVLFRRLDEVGGGAAGSAGLVTGAFGRGRRTGPATAVLGAAALVAALLTPAVLDGADLRQGHQFLALTVVFVSITAITGFSGHLTLGQASIAGLGAFATARFTAEFDLPVLVAMVPGIGVATLAGLAAGWPALKRKGLFLGLTTLGLALIIYQFVFNAQLPFVAGGPGQLIVQRPSLFGLDLSGDVAFWFYELVVVLLVLGLVHNLRSGPLGRVLAAMRDSETAASSVGIDLRRSKLFVFGVSSGIAGLGGTLLTQADQNFDPNTFYPIFGLFWFTAVVVCGVSSIRGAILAAAVYVAVPRITGQDVQSAVGIFGLGALFLGRLPGGVVEQLRRLPALLNG